MVSKERPAHVLVAMLRGDAAHLSTCGKNGAAAKKRQQNSVAHQPQQRKSPEETLEILWQAHETQLREERYLAGALERIQQGNELDFPPN